MDWLDELTQDAVADPEQRRWLRAFGIQVLRAFMARVDAEVETDFVGGVLPSWRRAAQRIVEQAVEHS